MEGVGKLPEGSVQCDFGSASVDLKVRGQKSYRFRIDPTFDSLKVEECSVNIKSNSLTIVLKKLNPKSWTSVKLQKKISKDNNMDEMSKAHDD